MNKLNEKLRIVKNKLLKKRKQYFGFFLIAPALFFSLLIIGFPLLQMISLSFMDYSLIRPTTLKKFVGITNYINVITDPKFYHSLEITLVFAFLVTSIGYITGLLSALFLNSLSKAKRYFNLFSLSICLPWAIPGAIVAYIFLLLFQDPGGIIAYWISKTGLDVNYFSQKLPSLFLIVTATVWKSYPLVTMGLLAGLQSISDELYEAASIDGASNFRKFFNITLPALKSITTVVLILNGAWAFKEFEIIWILTGGGPARFTQTLGITLYNEAFTNFNFGYASTIGVVILIINLLFIFFYIRVITKNTFY